MLNKQRPGFGRILKGGSDARRMVEENASAGTKTSARRSRLHPRRMPVAVGQHTEDPLREIGAAIDNKLLGWAIAADSSEAAGCARPLPRLHYYNTTVDRLSTDARPTASVGCSVATRSRRIVFAD